MKSRKVKDHASDDEDDANNQIVEAEKQTLTKEELERR